MCSEGNMVLGIICGITLNISFGSINIAEIIFILYSIAYLIKKKKIKIDKNFNTYIIFSLIFIMYTFCYYKLEIVSNENIMKNAIKYTEMLIITFLAYEQCIYDVDKFLKFFEVFLLTDFVFSYLGHTYKSFSYFIHYSFFILLMCILLVIYDKNKKVKTLLYIIAFILSIVGHSRSSLIILLITILYEMYQYILSNKREKSRQLKKVLVITMLLISALIGLNYFTENLAIKSASNTERTLLLNTTIEEIKENFIFGVGPGNFNYYAQNVIGVKLASTELTAHNHFLEIFAEWGILGFIIYMYPLIGFIIKLIKKEKVSLRYKKLYIFYFVFLFFNVLSGDARIKFAIILAIMFYDKYINGGNDFIEKRNSNIKLQ